VLCTKGVSSDGMLNVEMPVTNTGMMAGDEIVQLYIGYPNMTTPKMRVPELKAFTRVSLKPGETKTVPFSVPVRDMSYWDSANSKWAVEKGGYSVFIGPSADPTALKQATFTVN